MLLVFVPKCYFTFAKIILSTICNFTVASIRLIFFKVMAPPFVTISTFVDQKSWLWHQKFRCATPTPSLSSASAKGAVDHAQVNNKLQQFFYTLSVSQGFSLFLDLTYSSNVLSITCILCKTVTSTSRTLVIT